MKEKRFEVVESQGTGFSNYFQVIVDTETGVNYLSVKTGYGSGLTPLLDKDGKPLITKEENM